VPKGMNKNYSEDPKITEYAIQTQPITQRNQLSVGQIQNLK